MRATRRPTCVQFFSNFTEYPPSVDFSFTETTISPHGIQTMAIALQLCSGVLGAPHRVELGSFEEFADSLRDLDVVTDKRNALTLMPVELMPDPTRSAAGEVEKTLANVASVTALALDFDDVTEEQMLAVLGKDMRGLRWAAHTTFSHHEALGRGVQRWRVWVELDAPVPAPLWTRAREALDATLSAPVDAQTRNANRLVFAPCARPGEEASFEVMDWREFPRADQAVPFHVPADSLAREVAIPSRAGESAEPSEPVGLDDLRKLRDKLRRRASKFENVMGEYVAALVRGAAYVTKGSHEPTLDLARTLAEELPDAAAWSLAALVAPSLAVMRAEHGSDETERGFEEKVRSWRKRKAAEKAKFALPRALMGNPRTETGENAAGETPEQDIAYAPDAATALNAHFAIHQNSAGVEVIYETLPGEVCVRQSTINKLTDLLTTSVPFEEDGKQMTVQLARSRVENWKPFSPRFTSEPEPSRFKSEAGPCFQRLPFDPTPGPTPAWDEFTSRLSNADLFKAFIWTGFEKKNRGRQVLWVKGEGEDGKSTVMAVISEALGKAATAIGTSTFAPGNRFGITAVDGKRFAIVFDCKDTKFLMNEILRNVTSGDEVIVEYKGETPETKRLNVKVVVCSNYAPDLTSARADTSRLILLNIEQSLNRDDPTWEGRLKNELPAFLAACREAYERLCPHHGKLPLGEEDRAAINERTDAYEEEFAEAMEELFVVTGNREDTAPAKPIRGALVGRGLASRNWLPGKYEEFKRYLWRQGIINRRVSVGRIFCGVKLRARGDVKPFEGKKT